MRHIVPGRPNRLSSRQSLSTWLIPMAVSAWLASEAKLLELAFPQVFSPPVFYSPRAFWQRASLL